MPAIQWKRGMFRVWVVGTVLWVAFAANHWDAADRSSYAYNYAFNYKKLSPPQDPKRDCKYGKAIDILGNASAMEKPIQEQKVIEEECLKNWKPYSPDKPSWDWLYAMLLPPTVGVAAFLGILYALFGISRWVWRGFSAES